MSLHLRLKHLRGLRKLNHQQMADRLHICRSAYTKMEANTASIRLEQLHRIAAVLEVSPALLASAQASSSDSQTWNDFDLMLETAFYHLSQKFTVVPYDELTEQQLSLVTSKGFGSREAYEDTPLNGRLYTYGPRQAIDELFRGLSFATLFEYQLIQNPTWLTRWQRHQTAPARAKLASALPPELQALLVDEPEVDETDYLVVLLITLTMPDGSEQHVELAHRDIPDGMDEQQALEQLITSRGASDGEIMAFTFDGYTTYEEIVTDIYAS
ncbi:helix-turn-helix domain-containing protein [Hymenobacter endophyticus]|uniref:Helix-turn-helix transcriptional regulator n=1 Tax=Hymenobacter endophyticus TaxID=3076335 RepID=A0ABU3TL68_9BACT|nr:helix-turn-helix transcriptional regulator [Hymenobacter endophyticus]MDU0372127.1 helix-turn-helix transcriptional regulator [Hymenobacter endophyticus]